MEELRTKAVVITGASCGLGEGIARAFAKRGAAVAICGRNQENLSKVADKCTLDGAVKVVKIVADLLKIDDMKKLVETAVANLGTIDVLVNNAGAVDSATLEEVNIENFDHIFQLNTRAPCYLTQLCLPHLKQTKGCVVNISSMVTSVCIPQYLLYSMSKSALDHFTKNSALELAKYDIRVNAINPSLIDTDILRKVVGEEKATRLAELYASYNPLGETLLSVEEVSETVIFLATSASRCITGSCLPTDRGRILFGK